MLDAQWPLLFTFWPLCIFCPWTVPCNCHPRCGVWLNGQQVLWALYASVLKAPSQPGALFHLVLGVGFSFSSSFTLQLTSNSSCFLSILCASNGRTWLSHFSDTPKCSAELVFRRLLPTSYCLCVVLPELSLWIPLLCHSQVSGVVRFQKVLVLLTEHLLWSP